MFGALALSNQDHFRPEGFWRAFKDYDGEPINVREHQDAYEFFTRLQARAPRHRVLGCLRPVRAASASPSKYASTGMRMSLSCGCSRAPWRPTPTAAAGTMVV